MKVRSVRLSCRLKRPCPPSPSPAGEVSVAVTRSMLMESSPAREWSMRIGLLAIARPLRFRSAFGDEAVNPLLQHGQRHRTQRQHRVVEMSDVEFSAERFLRLRAQRADFQVTEFIAVGLSRP